MDQVYQQHAIEHIHQLLNLVTLSDEEKQKVVEQLEGADDERLEELIHKLELIHRWEIEEDIYLKLQEIEHTFDEWMDQLKKGAIKEISADKMASDQQEVQSLLNQLKALPEEGT